MVRRFVSIWFCHFATDWFSLRQPQLKTVPFVLRTASHGKMIVTAVNAKAAAANVSQHMPLADARAFVPNLQVQDDQQERVQQVLKRLAEWCIRFTPMVSIDPPDGLFFDATGCTHLWGGDEKYLHHVINKLQARGYEVRASMAGTPGAAWAVARYADKPCVIEDGPHIEALLHLPPEALRLEKEASDRLHKLGLHQIKQFINMPRASLRKRLGTSFLSQLDKATGQEMELLEPVHPLVTYQERLPCLEPIVTATGIEMALRELLKTLCLQLQQAQKGLRTAVFKGLRVDGKTEQISIATNRPSYHVAHLFKLFENKLTTIEPALGIELFILEAPVVEEYLPQQERMWQETGGLDDMRIAELVDRLSNRLGNEAVHRYLPSAHYWPERSFTEAASLQEKSSAEWVVDKLRPLQLLATPERIEVTAPIPDYPPMLFRHQGKVHQIARADGPERIEQEWWLQQGQHRDYYRVEDEEGNRYWLFRLGHYHDKTYQWFLHGYFA